jgi:hypothetical protein
MAHRSTQPGVAVWTTTMLRIDERRRVLFADRRSLWGIVEYASSWYRTAAPGNSQVKFALRI